VGKRNNDGSKPPAGRRKKGVKVPRPQAKIIRSAQTLSSEGRS
jgi:hypothetical protein